VYKSSRQPPTFCLPCVANVSLLALFVPWSKQDSEQTGQRPRLCPGSSSVSYNFVWRSVLPDNDPGFRSPSTRFGPLMSDPDWLRSDMANPSFRKFGQQDTYDW
jgi:hypothetical protein